jgi:hypothetical protein
MPIVDTLLRLAEEPAFYTPKWSADILREVRKTLQDKFGYSPHQVQRRIGTMESAFPDAIDIFRRRRCLPMAWSA